MSPVGSKGLARRREELRLVHNAAGLAVLPTRQEHDAPVRRWHACSGVTADLGVHVGVAQQDDERCVSRVVVTRVDVHATCAVQTG